MNNIKISLETLKKVKGVGGKTLERILEQHEIDNGTTEKEKYEYDEKLHVSPNSLLKGDCLTLMNGIPDKSIDMILCDLPYGTTACKWDSIIPLDKLWEQYERIIKDNGAIVLTAAQPFTSALIMSNIKMFKYTWVWEKNKVGGVFNAKNRPLKIHEDVVVFSKSPAANVKGVRMNYFPQGVQDTEHSRVNSHRRKGETFGNRPSRLGLYTQTQTGYPRDVIKFDSVHQGLHPTQKPVALMEYLIKTYTNEGDLVLDNTMGSGTTCVACVNTNRQYIGMELDDEYYAVAQKRVNEAIEAKI